MRASSLHGYVSAPPFSVGNQLYRATCLFLKSEHATRLVGPKYIELNTQGVGEGCRGGELAPTLVYGANGLSSGVVNLGTPNLRSSCLPLHG